MSEPEPRAIPFEVRSGRFGVRGQPIVQLTLTRIHEFLREPEAVFWALLFPILLTTGLGIAFRNRPVEVVNVGATDQAVAAALRQQPGLAVTTFSPDEGREALRTGKVALLAARGSNGSVVFEFDETNPDARAARAAADDAVQRAAGRTDPVAVQDRMLREPGSRYVDFLVPGLVGLGIMSNALWGLGFSIVDARRRHLTKRLLATPMPRRDYLLSYLFWRMLILWAEVGVPVGFGVMAFGVPVRGRLVDLVLLCVLSSLSCSALGLLLASRARTIEGISGLVNLVQVPMWILSGVFFSARRFPAVVQPFISALPLTASVDALRAHMLQGASLAQVAPQLGVLGGWLVVCFALALKLFRWR
jgi:ABC-type multidrug transport system permease subunit